jgi:hypothetical protein
MSKFVTLSSLTKLFTPVDSCEYVFECQKNAQIPEQRNGEITLYDMRELYYIVYPNNPKKYDEIQHGQATSIFVFSKVDITSICNKNELQTFMYDIKKQARTDKSFYAKTLNSGILLVDNDPRIEYELPPESPLNLFRGLSDEVLSMTKLPEEIDQFVEETLLCLEENLFYFGHINSFYMFVSITGPNQFEVRHYTGSDNEKYETLFCYIKVNNNKVVAYVELADNESVMINKKLLIDCPDFGKFIRDMFNFDSKTHISVARSVQSKAQPKMTDDKFADDDDEDDINCFLGMPKNAKYSESMLNSIADMYGNPSIF